LYNSAEIAEAIKKTAKQKKIILKDMLAECELGINTVSHLYHGRMIAADSLAKIADYLGVTVDYLLGRGESADASKDGYATKAELAKSFDELKALILSQKPGAEAGRENEDA
jgi:transcriptional regulator with XRE-family HTH domain